MGIEEQQVTNTEPAGLDMEAAVEDIVSGMGFEEPKDETPAETTDKAATGDVKEALQPDGKTPPVKVDDPSASPTDPKAPVAAAPAPDTWTKEAQAEWDKVPSRVQQEIQKRETDIARYVSETKPKVEMGQGVERLLQPYMPLFTQYNVNPWNHMDALLKAHTALMFGTPQQKATMAFALLKDARIDPAKLTGGNPLAAIENEDPRVLAMQQRIAQLEQGVTGVTSELGAARQAERDATVVAFAEDPAHPYFYDVWQEIATLMENKVCSTLEDAYEKAVWGNPIARAKEIARQNTEKQKTAETARAAHLSSSRRAASVNVRGQPGANGAVGANVNWEDTLTETLADIKSR